MTRVDEPHRFVRLAAAIRQQQQQVEGIVSEAREALADIAQRQPTLLELRGIGAVLHDFYTGIEHVFEKIAPELNGGLPAGPAWRRELLGNMTLDLPGVRPPLLRVDTATPWTSFSASGTYSETPTGSSWSGPGSGIGWNVCPGPGMPSKLTSKHSWAFSIRPRQTNSLMNSDRLRP